MLKEIPQIIDSLNTSRLWDLTLFQLESDTHTFGIPGETWCFECDTNFQVSNLITFVYLHPNKNYHLNCPSEQNVQNIFLYF